MDGFIHTIKILMWRMRYTEKLMIIRTGITQTINRKIDDYSHRDHPDYQLKLFIF